MINKFECYESVDAETCDVTTNYNLHSSFSCIEYIYFLYRVYYKLYLQYLLYRPRFNIYGLF